METGAAINLGGGFHHCSSHEGGGFCAYADITLSLRFLRQNYPSKVKNVMIVDLGSAELIKLPKKSIELNSSLPQTLIKAMVMKMINYNPMIQICIY